MSAVRHIDRQDLKLVKKIGQGGFGTVFHMIWKSTSGDVDVAAKRLYEVERHELEVLSSLNHPNIVKLIGVVPEEIDFMLILELCEGGSLGSYLSKHKDKPLPNHLFRDWSKQAAKAIEYLQEMKIVHKDIKAENYLIAIDNVLKLADFGLAKKTGVTLSKATERGTAAYMAPELFTEGRLSPTFDIFAYGVVLWEMVTREIPFEGKEYQVIVYHVCDKGERLQIPNNCPNHLADLMRRCWLEDRHKRPSIKEILYVLSKNEEALPITTSLSHHTLKQDPVASSQRTRAISLPDVRVEQPDFNQDADNDETWKYERLFGDQEGSEQQNKCFGIALCPNGEVAVTCWRPTVPRVKVYGRDLGKSRISLVTTQGYEPGRKSQPWEIAVSSDGTFFVTDKTPHVKVFSADAEYMNRFVTKSPDNTPSAVAQFVELQGLAMNSKDQLLVGELPSRYISRHTQDGGHLGSIGVQIDPSHLAVTPHDTIIISSDRLNTPVLIVDETGQTIHTLNTPKGINSWWPSGVCCGWGQIFIATTADTESCVTCFSLSGDYSGRINIREVSFPTGIALTADGTRLMVVDESGNVKVFSRK